MHSQRLTTDANLEIEARSRRQRPQKPVPTIYAAKMSWRMNAWRVCAGPESSASLSWWPAIIRAAANSGSAAAGKRSPALLRWDL